MIYHTQEGNLHHNNKEEGGSSAKEKEEEDRNSGMHLQSEGISRFVCKSVQSTLMLFLRNCACHFLLLGIFDHDARRFCSCTFPSSPRENFDYNFDMSHEDSRVGHNI